MPALAVAVRGRHVADMTDLGALRDLADRLLREGRHGDAGLLIMAADEIDRMRRAGDVMAEGLRRLGEEAERLRDLSRQA